MIKNIPYATAKATENSQEIIQSIINNSLDFCKAIDRNLPILIYGMGNGADKVFNYLSKNNMEVNGVFASDDFVRGQSFRGHIVEKFSSLEKKYGQMNIIVGFGSNRAELIDRVQSLAERHRLFIPDFPVVGEELFTKATAYKNLEKLSAAHSLLADKASKKVFELLLGYKISAQPNLLWSMASERADVFTELLNLSENEIFVDGGAYRGDSIAEFLSYTSDKFSYILAFEPDVRTFKHLSKKYGDFKNIDLKNAALFSTDTEFTISDNLGRGTRLNKDVKTGKKISTTALDNLNIKPTYIKLDVEGEEFNALLGAKDTIISCKPKLNIALYHKAKDFFEIPLYIHSLNKNYKLYIRQHRHFPAWDLSLLAI